MSTVADILKERGVDIIDVDERRDEVTRRHLHRPSVSGKELKLVNDNWYYNSDMESRVDGDVVHVSMTYILCKRSGFRREFDKQILRDNYPGLLELRVLPGIFINPSPEIIEEYGLEKWFPKGVTA